MHILKLDSTPFPLPSVGDTARKSRRKLDKMAGFVKPMESPAENSCQPCIFTEEIITLAEDNDDEDSDDDDDDEGTGYRGAMHVKQLAIIWVNRCTLHAKYVATHLCVWIHEQHACQLYMQALNNPNGICLPC